MLPEQGTVLEVASGSGEHAVYFAAALPHLTWQPTDADPTALKSTAAYRDAARTLNLRPPLELDAATEPWPVSRVDAVVAINMVHISPWSATVGLFSGTSEVLTPSGVLYLYGPYRQDGVHTAPSNAVFDESLRARNPEWGVRDIAEMEKLGKTHGLVLVERISMPANNFSLVFRVRELGSQRAGPSGVTREAGVLCY